MRRVTHVFGPAYLDRVVLVDRSLHQSGRPPLDQSVDGTWRFGTGLTLRDRLGNELLIEPPPGWPGPTGAITLSTHFESEEGAATRTVRAVSWHDDLGGMGAGYAAALDGELFSALGDDSDAMSGVVSDRLWFANIRHRPIVVDGRQADWTLLVTSGPFGDKLPIGFRGCHAAIGSLAKELKEAGPCDLRVVASFPNRLAAEALKADGARVRFFAPAMRNMTDRSMPVGRFAGSIDVLCCNRREWESLEDREQVAWQVSVLAVTNGPDGSVVRFTTPEGEAGYVTVPAFPRERPPRDTNRAGEAYASTLVSTLLDHRWTPGVTATSLVRLAAERASAAAALELDRADFGFPRDDEIDAVLENGRVPG